MYCRSSFSMCAPSFHQIPGTCQPGECYRALLSFATFDSSRRAHSPPRPDWHAQPACWSLPSLFCHKASWAWLTGRTMWEPGLLRNKLLAPYPCTHSQGGAGEGQAAACHQIRAGRPGNDSRQALAAPLEAGGPGGARRACHHNC